MATKLSEGQMFYKKNSQNFTFSNLIISLQQKCIWMVHIVTKWSMSDLQMPRIKEPKIF